MKYLETVITLVLMILGAVEVLSLFSDDMYFAGIQNSGYKQIVVAKLLDLVSPKLQRLAMEETLQYLLVENGQPSINASFWIENNIFSAYPSKEYLESMDRDFVSFFFRSYSDQVIFCGSITK